MSDVERVTGADSTVPFSQTFEHFIIDSDGGIVRCRQNEETTKLAQQLVVRIPAGLGCRFVTSALRRLADEIEHRESLQLLLD